MKTAVQAAVRLAPINCPPAPGIQGLVLARLFSRRSSRLSSRLRVTVKPARVANLIIAALAAMVSATMRRKPEPAACVASRSSRVYASCAPRQASATAEGELAGLGIGCLHHVARLADDRFLGLRAGAGQDGNVALMVDVGEALGESCGQTGQAGHEAEIARLVRKSGKEGTLQVGVLR